MKNAKKLICSLLILFMAVASSFTYSQAAMTTPKQVIIINTRTNRLGYYKSGKLVKEFRVATGKASTPTPTGKTKVVNKIKNRPYYSGGIAGGAPNNPLGDRWLGLNLNGTYGTTYAIHGNNNASSIGKSVSAGCVRMHNSEIRWLYDQVTIGTLDSFSPYPSVFQQIIYRKKRCGILWCSTSFLSLIKQPAA